MEEDEEVNIMDLNVPLVSQNVDLSDFEHTLRPKWLLDKHGTSPEVWCEETSASVAPEQFGNVPKESSDWSEKEKNLLERGVEIFGKSAVRLSQFVGSKSASEIRNFMKNSASSMERNSLFKKGKIKMKTRKTKTVKPSKVLLRGEEIVKIEKTENSDSEIDIEDVDENPGNSSKNDGNIRSGSSKDKLRKSTPTKRFKRKFLNNGEGGCTLSHGDNGEIIETVIVDKEITPKQKIQRKPPPVYLIYCKPYVKDEFRVTLDVSALFLMDFHAHSSHSEVMGLLGGFYDESSKNLHVNHYEPCKNQASSTTHCDMCPVSQAHSAENIRNLNMSPLGWFHSHPTFAPEPSQQDLETQCTFQESVGKCIGVILSPFNRISPSEFRCVIVEGNEPFKLKVEVNSNRFNPEQFSRDLQRVKKFIEENQEDVTFLKRYLMYEEHSSYLHKFVNSFRMMFERYFVEFDGISWNILEECVYNIFK